MMRRAGLLVSLLVACDAGAPPTGPRPDQVAQAEIYEAKTRAQAELDAVARAILDRFAADHTTVPDSGLLEHEKTFFVDRELERDGTGGALTDAALPSSSFKLRAAADMQADADRSHDPVQYIFIHDLHIEGDRATFWLGVHVKLPDIPEGSGTCCCSAEQVYVERGGSWSYAQTTSEICS